MSRLNRIRSAVKPIAGTIKEAHVLTYAAAADYHVFIALAPALMLLVSLIRFLPVTQEEVLKVFSDTISDQAFSFIDSLASSVFNSNETTTVISSLLLLVSASGAIRSLMKGLDEVYGTKRKEPFLIFAGRAMVYTLLFLVMIVVSLILLVYGSGLLAYVLSISPEHSFLEKAIPFLQDTRYFLWGLILIPIFMFLYHRLPSGKRKF